MTDKATIGGAQNTPLHDTATGTKHGVPAGVAQEESKGWPDAGRHQSESAPIHPDEPKSDT